jgi:hypothetical protein
MVNTNLKLILLVELGFVVLYSFEGGTLMCQCDRRNNPCKFTLKDFSNFMTIVCRVEKE